jgi:hypothetical protein
MTAIQPDRLEGNADAYQARIVIQAWDYWKQDLPNSLDEDPG